MPLRLQPFLRLLLTGMSCAMVLSSISIAPRHVMAAGNLEVGIFLPTAVKNSGSLTLFENSLGLIFDSTEWYMSFNDEFDANIADRFHNQGKIVQMIWEPYTQQGSFLNSDITQGKWDQYLDNQAKKIKNIGYPIRVSFAPEMNSSWSAWGAERPGNNNETSKAMYRYVVERFRSQGVTNVQWIWSPNTHYWGERYTYADLFPGDAYVDFLGLDGYNWGNNYPGGTWISFKNTYSSSYNEMVSISNRRILIMEIGSSEFGGNKADWISDMFRDIRTTFPRIQGINWFNEYKEVDWRIESSESSRQAFAQAVAHDRQNQRSQVVPTSPLVTTTASKDGTKPVQPATNFQNSPKLRIAKDTFDPATSQTTFNALILATTDSNAVKAIEIVNAPPRTLLSIKKNLILSGFNDSTKIWNLLAFGSLLCILLYAALKIFKAH